MTNMHVERIRRAGPGNDVWQAGLVRLPMWVQEGGSPPERPWAGLCVSLRTGLVHTTEPRSPREQSPGQVLDALAGLLANRKLRGCRPARIEVRSRALSEYLSSMLAGTGIDVVQAADLAAFDFVVEDLTRHLLDSRPDPAALKVPNVTVAHLRAFAEAAEALYESRPWQHLSDVDLITVESPAAPRGLGHLAVLGAAGREYGLAFFGSPRDHERLQGQDDPATYFARDGAWLLTYGPLMDLPFGDADAWEEHGLAVASDNAYPLLACFGPGERVRRPTAEVWAWVEGLARAVAQTTEAELDGGRWSKRVETVAGPRDITLALPALLEPARPARPPKPGILDRRAMERMLIDMQRAAEGREFASVEQYGEFLRENFCGREVPHQPPRTPLERAQDTMYEAFEAQGRRRVQLARKALELCPDCADAYVLLAEHKSDLEEARDLYAQGMAAGERALGTQIFKEDAGRFWGIVETRPYMRARFGLARCCEELGDLQAAVGHYEALLRLNRSDNQGVRYPLAACLLRSGDLDRLGAVLREHDEETAHWGYLWALWAFRKHGDGPEARRRLAAAHKANPHVRKYLAGSVPLPDPIPDCYSFGDEREAAIIASELSQACRATPGAADWLRAGMQSTRERRRRRPRG